MKTGSKVLATLIALPLALAWSASTARPARAFDLPQYLKKHEVAPLVYDGPFGTKLELSISNQFRPEFVNWWKTPPGSPIPDSDYNFQGNRLKLGVRATRGPVEVFVQGQYVLLNNLPEGGPGPGGIYFANTHETFQEAVMLRNAYMKVAGWGPLDGFSVTFGRMPYLDGAEAPILNPTLKWVVTQRVAQRLIGPFEYTMVGRSFDGGQLVWQNDLLNVTGFGFVPTRGGFEIDANADIPEINVGGVSLTVRDSKALPRSTGRLFFMAYTDDRDVVVLDNRPLAVREAEIGEPLDIYTIGANAAHVEPLGPGNADFLAYGLGQLGSWQSQDHSAWAYAFEAGYQLPELWGKPWMRFGIDSASGDPDPDDDLHQTFFQMLPTARLYAQTPFYNMMNDQDVFVQWLLQPASWLGARVDLHWLRTNSAQDFAYFGGGATKADFFGYGGVPSKGRHELAYLVDFALTFNPMRNLSIYLYYGHAFGQGIVDQNFLTRDLDYGYVDFFVSF